jgi:rhomboid protease GluP
MLEPNTPTRHPLEEAPQPRPRPANARRLILRYAARQPYVTYALIAVNVVIFIIRALSYEIDLNLLLAGANSGAAVFGDGDYWRLLTSMFLHASIYASANSFAFERASHIVFNMFTLYYVGSTVERAYGHGRFLAIYLLGGIVGSLFSAALNDAGSIGASGAVFAVLAAEFVFFQQHTPLMGDYARQRTRGLLVLAVFNLAGGLLSEIGGGMMGGALRIDNWAHLGGAFGGLALAAIAGARYLPIPRPMLKIVIARDASDVRRSYRLLGLCALALLVAIVVLTVRYQM